MVGGRYSQIRSSDINENWTFSLCCDAKVRFVMNSAAVSRSCSLPQFLSDIDFAIMVIRIWYWYLISMQRGNAIEA